MLSLHVTLYTTDEGDRFKVFAPSSQDDMVDVTDRYELAAIATEDGRTGWCVLPIGKPEGRHPSGAEL